MTNPHFPKTPICLWWWSTFCGIWVSAWMKYHRNDTEHTGWAKIITLLKLYRKQICRTQNFIPTPIDRETLKVLFKMTRFCCAPSLANTAFENGFPTTEELVCSAVSEEGVRNSCATYVISRMEPPSRVFIYAWYNKFEKKGCISKAKSHVWCNIWTCFQRSPQKPTRRASRELQLPQRNVPKIPRKRLLTEPYKL